MNPAFLTALFVMAQPAAAPTMPLWEGKAPHAVGDTEFDKPKLHLYPAPADKATGAAVVICPGGGYGNLAMDHEGKQVAEFFNGLGISAFVLQYRVAKKERPGPLHPAPLEDAQRAIRTVRSFEKKFNIDPKRVGLIGFSAGGHLASTAGTHFDAGNASAADPIDRLSCRPDFLILGYPVITMEPGVTHGGTKKNLLGDKPEEALLELYSNEKQVTAQTPPTFIFQTNEDTGVPAENAVLFYLALRKAKVPTEIHIYEKGKHGVGMNPTTKTPTDTWGARLADWLVMREYGKK